MTRRRLFGMFAGLIGVPPVASVLEPDFGDLSFDMAVYLKAEWHKKLYTTCRDVDIAFCNSILKPTAKAAASMRRLGVVFYDVDAWRKNENDNRDRHT